MRSLRVGLAIGVAGVALLAGCAKPPKATTEQSLPTTTTSTPIAHEWNGDGPGDGPPDAADNELHPKTISPADQAAGDAAATKVKAALTRVQRNGAVTKVTVQVSRRRELHPPPLVEPCVTVSRYTAPAVEPVGKAPCFQ